MALPHTITERATSARCSRLAPSLATNARGDIPGRLLVALEAALGSRPAALLSWCPTACAAGSLRGMPASPMRATRPNVGRSALPPRVAQAGAPRVPHGLTRRWSRIATAGLNHRALLPPPGGQPFQSAQLQR